MEKNGVFRWEDEVRDSELDMQGIVNNGNYFRYMEHARHKHIKSLGIDFADYAARGLDLVLTHTDITFKDSLKSGDEFIVTSRLAASGRIRFAFHQEIIRKADNKVMVIGINTGACLNRNTGRPEIPEELKNVLIT